MEHFGNFGFGVCGTTGSPAQNRTYSCQINKDLYEILSSTTAPKNTKTTTNGHFKCFNRDPMKCCPSADCSFVLAFKAVSLGTMWWNLMPFFTRFKLIRHLATTKMISNIN